MIGNGEFKTKLANVESEVNKVIDLGRSWGMTEKEIRDCVDEAVLDHHDDNISSTRAESEDNAGLLILIVLGIWFILKSVLKYIVILCLTVTLLYTTLFICSSFSPELENKVGKITASWTYPTMRIARILLKPFADRFNIGGLYEADCLVSNPFFMDTIEDCEPCHTKSRFADLTGKSVGRWRRHAEDLHPFVIKGYMKSKVDLAALHKMYLDNEAKFKFGGGTKFDSNLANVYNVSDFFSEYNQETFLDFQSGTGYLTWGTNNVAGSQAIRKIFPRPTFLSSNAEVSLLKRIYIESPLVGSHELPIGGFTNGWYQQAHGTRHLTLVPHRDCRNECRDIELTVEAGDLVFYQDQFWRLISDPVIVKGQGVAASKDVSISFTGSFTF